MAMNVQKTMEATLNSRSLIKLVPFTGGLFILYAFFFPVSYGNWLGTIVGAFRRAAGF